MTDQQPRDKGETLITLLVVIMVLGIIAAPLTGLLVTMLRTNALNQQTAERQAAAGIVVSLAERLPVDPCDAAALEAAVEAQYGTDHPDYEISLSVDCSSAVTAIVGATVTDAGGKSTELEGFRPLVASAPPAPESTTTTSTTVVSATTVPATTVAPTTSTTTTTTTTILPATIGLYRDGACADPGPSAVTRQFSSPGGAVTQLTGLVVNYCVRLQAYTGPEATAVAWAMPSPSGCGPVPGGAVATPRHWKGYAPHGICVYSASSAVKYLEAIAD